MTHKIEDVLRQEAIEASLKPENRNKWCTAVKTDFGRVVWINTRISEAKKSVQYYTAVHAKNGKVYERPTPAPEPPDMIEYQRALVALDNWRDAEKTKIDIEYQRRLSELRVSDQP